MFVAKCTPFLNEFNSELLQIWHPNCFSSVHDMNLYFTDMCNK